MVQAIRTSHKVYNHSWGWGFLISTYLYFKWNEGCGPHDESIIKEECLYHGSMRTDSRFQKKGKQQDNHKDWDDSEVKHSRQCQHDDR